MTHCNPYQPPKPISLEPQEAEMECTRASLAKTIEAFLDDRLTAFEFWDRLDVFFDSNDITLRDVAGQADCFCDEFVDHQVCLSKPQWDYLQRLLLVLASDSDVESNTTYHWNVRQLIAAIALGTFVFFACQVGWGIQLLVLAIPFGFISIFLSSTFGLVKPEPPSRPSILAPFATMADLEKVYRSSNFRKTRYPRYLATRTSRNSNSSTLPVFVSWLLLAPIPLFYQMFPKSQTRYLVRAK